MIPLTSIFTIISTNPVSTDSTTIAVLIVTSITANFLEDDNPKSASVVGTSLMVWASFS